VRVIVHGHARLRLVANTHGRLEVPAAGPTKKLCGAQRMGQPKGVTCKRVAGAGTDHLGTGTCSRHLGNTANHRTAAENEAARQACALFGLEMQDRPPAQVLIDEITRTRRSIAWHETEIATVMGGRELDAGKLERLMTRWMGERKHLADVTAKALHAGVERRAVELMEDEARRAVAMLEAYTAALGLDRRDPRVLEAGRVALQVLPGGS
jgi:hypothetical protein